VKVQILQGGNVLLVQLADVKELDHGMFRRYRTLVPGMK
jgi:hypothetical protein